MSSDKKIKRKPLVLTILDGWGVGPKDKKINAIEAAETPFFDSLVKNYPYAELDATGEAVGLEKNQMSGSEAGHLNIGAGRVVQQDVRIILEEICSGRFFQNPVFLSTINQVKRLDSNIHLVGMMGNSDSPHSHPDVFLSLLILLKQHHLEGKVFIHLFTDGRDSFPKSALEHWKKWKGMINQVGIGKLATVCGRFYAMDRVKNWERLLKAFNALTRGEGDRVETFEKAIENNYTKGNTDEFIEPTVIVEDHRPVGRIKDNDGVIFFNLRSDRARQFSKFFVGTHTEKEDNFPKFEKLRNISFVAMTNFGPDLSLKTAYPANPVPRTLPVTLSSLRQLYISETEKYAHVTYFINGGYAEAIGGEDRVLIESPKVRSYEEKPEMASSEITEVIAKNISYGVYDFIVVNFPNSDMVAHTGNFEATKKGIEAVDKCLEKIYDEVKKKSGIMIVTADHGNADIMIDEKSGRSFTFHTKNPVPFILVSEEEELKNLKLKEGGKLANIAPTILKLLNIFKPEEMTEESLF